MRVIVVTCLRRGSASICLPALIASPEIEVVRVVLASRTMAGTGTRIRRALRKIRRIGLLGALNGVRLRRWYRGEEVEDIEALCARYRVPFQAVPSLNSPETEAAFRAAGADLGLSLGNSYISPRIFEIPEKGMINLHGEILPEYRGAQSVLWPIHEGSDQTGFTIHRIDSTIDGGDILYQVRHPIRFRPTLRETVVHGSPGGDEVAAAVRLVCEEFDRLAAVARPQGSGRSYTTPTIRQFVRMLRNHRRMHRESSRTPPAS